MFVLTSADITLGVSFASRNAWWTLVLPSPPVSRTVHGSFYIVFQRLTTALPVGRPVQKQTRIIHPNASEMR